MKRNTKAITITELINELEAINDIIGYIEICETNARKACKDYMQCFADTGEEYWRDEALEQDAKADTYAECKRYLLAYAME